MDHRPTIIEQFSNPFRKAFMFQDSPSYSSLVAGNFSTLHKYILLDASVNCENEPLHWLNVKEGRYLIVFLIEQE